MCSMAIRAADAAMCSVAVRTTKPPQAITVAA
jgi:hypothetical protein